MVAAEFSELVGRLLQAMGQQMDAVRPVPEGLLLRTGDGFLFAFVEDSNQVSLAFAQSLLAEVAPHGPRLVVMARTHLPPALDRTLRAAGATVVDGARFLELVRELGLEVYLGEEPRAPPPGPARRLLPSAQQLDTIMHRARTWLDWGVPALALRFYRQAAALKPEFAPARVGVGRSLLALGLTEDADRAFDEALESQPDDVEARVGKAAVLGSKGRVAEEVKSYRRLLEEDPGRVAVRTHLVAALISEAAWKEALTEIDHLLSDAPEDPQLRFLRSAGLEKLGKASSADEERSRARRLGLTPEREKALCEHLGLPPPELPSGAPSVPAATAEGARAVPTRRSRSKAGTAGSSAPRGGSATANRRARPKRGRSGRKPK